MDYNSYEYDKARKYIAERFAEKKEKEEVLYLGCTPGNYMVFESINSLHEWGLSVDQWRELVELEWETYKNTNEINQVEGVIFSNQEQNMSNYNIDKNGAWRIFKERVLTDMLQFPPNTIENIEKDSLNIARQLNMSSNDGEPVKGLVIGDIQSGKTTNMAALMAMLSGVGYNFFIILSGTAENLRVQTENRITKLLQPTSHEITWTLIKNPKNAVNNGIHNLFKKSNNHYMVVLKNSTRMKDLINWIQGDQKLKKYIKLVVIDDEADQASVNTSKDPEKERKQINKSIINLIHNRTYRGKKSENSFATSNYIGYTATPYANILSESPDSKDSLYPVNFISMLSRPFNHFNAREIFGTLDGEANGLDIINTFENTEDLKSLLQNKTEELPIKLKEAISYFIAAGASLRLHNFSKPVSMLVHASNRIDDHNTLYSSIRKWLSESKDEVIRFVERVWNEQKRKIGTDSFSSNILIDERRTLKLHDYIEIEQEVNRILQKIDPITTNEEDLLSYHNGIHMILEHSQATRDADEVYRLFYPDKVEDLRKTPLFLVIGGTSVSRGITLEGLISTYFIRNSSAVDTLSQMGRWFGYRINYELYPRIWMTHKARENFRYISTLEEQLREEITQLYQRGANLREVSPKLMYMPQYINLTSRNKSYAANYNMDFTGFSTQSYIFHNDIEIQQRNIKLTEKFLNGLGQPIIHEKIAVEGDAVYWKNIDFKDVKAFLSEFTFTDRIKTLSNMDYLIKWIDEATQNSVLDKWNIILGGVGKANDATNNWIINEQLTYNMVNRSKKRQSAYDDINIGVLSNPQDLLADVDGRNSNLEEILDLVENKKVKLNLENIRKIRKKVGYEKTPQLIIYRIDKNSKPINKKDREPLGTDFDIIGLYIVIPNDLTNLDYKNRVTVKIDIEDKKIMGFDYE